MWPRLGGDLRRMVGRRVVTNSGPTLVLIFASVSTARRSGSGAVTSGTVRADQEHRRVEGASIRELADRHRVHRRTVRQALEAAVPPPRNPYPQRPRPAMDAYASVIDGQITT